MFLVFTAWKNSLGLSLGFVHAVSLLLIISAKEPLPPPLGQEPDSVGQVGFDTWATAGESIYASRVFHWSHEDPFTKFLMLADLPSQLVGAIVVGLPLLPFSAVLSPVTQSNIGAAVWVLFGSAQWWLLGTQLSLFVSRRREH